MNVNIKMEHSMELWNAQQVAKFLGITYNQLWRLIAEKKPHPPYTLVGDRKRFIRSEVERWLFENQVSSKTVATDDGHD